MIFTSKTHKINIKRTFYLSTIQRLHKKLIHSGDHTIVCLLESPSFMNIFIFVTKFRFFLFTVCNTSITLLHRSKRLYKEDQISDQFHLQVLELFRRFCKRKQDSWSKPLKRSLKYVRRRLRRAETRIVNLYDTKIDTSCLGPAMEYNLVQVGAP